MNFLKKYSLADILRYSIYILINTIILKYLSSLIYKIKVRYMGIDSGKVNVIGKVILLRFPSSIIKVGDNCNFTSSNKTAGAATVSIVRLKTFTPSASIIIEDNVDLNGTSIAARSKKIFIKKNTLIGPNVIITDSDFHCLDARSRVGKNKKACFERDKDIHLGENVWIGMNCIILKGTVIGNNTIVGAGSVVSGTLDANSIYAGNPVHKVREL